MKQCSTCGAVYRGDPQTCPLDGTTLQEAASPALGTRVGG
jgi:RNA polymerase subunit RPABC4/transcription elongation factor Spt4